MSGEGRLAGRVGLVTGGGSGIGRATAQRLAAEGAEVAVVDVRGAEEVAAGIEADGGSALGIVTDVADAEAVAHMAATAIDCFGRVDALVNNAGILDDYLPAADTPDEVWDRVLGVNLRGVFNTSRALIPQMLEIGGGAIVNVASTAALVGGNGGAAYTTSKHAIVGFTRQLCFDYAEAGIRANTVCPGAVETGMTKEIFAAGDAEVMKAVRSAPIGRWAQPDELASVIAFLCSDDAAFVHGATYVVDGGFSVK